MLGIFSDNEQNAISLLKKDHEDLKDLFDRFEATKPRTKERRDIVADVIKKLKAHAAVEEEIFYPAVRKTVGDKIMNEADEEHHVAKLLVAELEKMKGTEDHFDAKFTVLAESVKHHIKEEEDSMLPKAEDTDINFEALGEEILMRKEELAKKGFPLLPEEKLMGAHRGRNSPNIGTRARKASKGNSHIANTRKNHHAGISKY